MTIAAATSTAAPRRSALDRATAMRLAAEENERFWDYALLHGLACQTRAARGDWAQAQAHAAAAAQWAPLVGTRSGLLSAAAARAMIAQAQPDAAALLAAARDMEDTFDPAGLLAGLTGAERRVAQLARGDLSNEEIARQLSIQRGSVEFHLTSIYRKLGVAGRTALRRMLAEPE